jgi:hypothetical protein
MERKSMARKSCDSCSRGGSFPVWGEGFTRRRFLQLSGTGIVASYFGDILNPYLLHAATTASPTLYSTAKQCILVFLAGAPSHVDTWDFKEGSWTPPSLSPTSYGQVRWPQGLMPRTAEQMNHLSFVRSGLSWAAVHGLAQVWAQISRNPTGALGSISPHIGAVVALESQVNRKPHEVLPGFVSLNSGTTIGAGYLSARYAPLTVQPSTNGLPAFSHPDGAARFNERWDLLQKIDGARDGQLGKKSLDMKDFYDQARILMDTPDINSLFTYTPEESARYGDTGFGNSMVIARKLVSGQRGVRFVQVTQNGWDHHDNIYGTAGSSLFTQCATFDPAFGSLLADLAATPGSEPGKTQLDETLVVVLAEFGRTVGALNNQGGRDHFLRMSMVFAGGGSRGGRIIGQTDELGDKVKEYGWSANRDVRPEDVTCTIYSALGIDYTTVRRDDPLGRGFEYVPNAREGLYQPINELF